MNPGEFPHSEISGSQIICISPKLIAAYHVFHRVYKIVYIIYIIYNIYPSGFSELSYMTPSCAGDLLPNPILCGKEGTKGKSGNDGR